MPLEYETMSLEDARVLSLAKDAFNLSFIFSGRKYELHEKKVKPLLDIKQGEVVVEIGVGDGDHLKSYTGHNYLGFDINDVAVLRARSIEAAHRIPSQNIRLKQSGILPLPAESVDKIFSVCAIHEMDNIEAELAEMDRVLKKGGRVNLVERMCGFSESSKAIANLKRESELFNSWFSERGYSLKEDLFRASYYGEVLQQDKGFQFHMFLAEKGH